MNDELSGQLCRQWNIPNYAQNHLWLDSESGAVRCEGGKGLFELEAAAQILTLRWGGAAGPPLPQLRWQADHLQWDGSIRAGGMVEALHLMEMPQLDLPVAVIYFSAQPLKPGIKPYPDVMQRQQTHFAVPDYLDAVDDDIQPQLLTLLTTGDSTLTTAAQDAMLNKMPLHAYGHLSDEEQGWHHFFALPILWESVTLFAA